MTKGGISKEPKKRLKQPKPEYRRTLSIGFSLFATFVVAVGVLMLSSQARAQELSTHTTIYCGEKIKPLVLSASPNFSSNSVAPLACGAKVQILAREGDAVGGWTKVRTQNGTEGFVPSCFVGSMPPLKVGKCNRPDPIGTLTRFEHLSDTLRGFVEAEHFSDEDLKSISLTDTEKLAAKCYMAAYATAEKPGWVKAEIFRTVIDNQIFGSDFSKLSSKEQVSIQVWLQKLLNVLSKAFDLGYKDGAKVPCNPQK